MRGRTNRAAYTHTHAHGFGLLGYDCSRLVEGSTANIAGVAQRKNWKLVMNWTRPTPQMHGLHIHTRTRFGLLGMTLLGVAQRKKWKLDPAHAPEFDTERHTGGEGLHRCRCLPASKLHGAGDGAPEFQHVLSRSATRSRSQSGPAWVAYNGNAVAITVRSQKPI